MQLKFKRRIEKVIKLLRKSKTYDQSTWTSLKRHRHGINYHWCRTPACIAGHAWVAMGRSPDGWENCESPHEVARWMGLNPLSEVHLFYGRDRVSKASALRALRRLIKTGDVSISWHRK